MNRQSSPYGSRLVQHKWSPTGNIFTAKPIQWADKILLGTSYLSLIFPMKNHDFPIKNNDLNPMKIMGF